MPASKQDLDSLLNFLIVTPFNAGADGDAKVARKVALKRLTKLTKGDAFSEHSDGVWSLYTP